MKLFDNRIAREKAAPDYSQPLRICACGCGGLTNWNHKQRVWREYLWGHHTAERNRNTHYTISEERRQRLSERMSGERNPSWKGGKTARRKKRHSLVFNGRKMLAHRAIMSRYLGRELAPWEVVHHIDEDERNNAPENLHLFHCTFCHNWHHGQDLELTYRYDECVRRYGHLDPG